MYHRTFFPTQPQEAEEERILMKQIRSLCNHSMNGMWQMFFRDGTISGALGSRLHETPLEETILVPKTMQSNGESG